jgi:hypothetical protein
MFWLYIRKWTARNKRGERVRFSIKLSVMFMGIDVMSAFSAMDWGNQDKFSSRIVGLQAEI